VISGVIFDAAKDELFFAEKGTGAWMNGPSMKDERLRVSARARVSDSLYATGIPFAASADDLPQTTQQLKRLMPICAGVRRFGSAALDLAYVAAGRYDGYWERGLKSWDIAAGVIIAREAGAIVEALEEHGDEPHALGSIICSNDSQFNEFKKIIRM
jgi:myo-inositol-1(or 4)-monophosphatase